MTSDKIPLQDHLKKHLDRSDDLHGAMIALLEGADFDESTRAEASLGMCSLSFEHAFSVRLLMGSGCPTSATAMVRLQFEATTRAMWLLYAAPDDDIEKLMAQLSTYSEEAARKLPTVSKMIDAIGREVGTKAPAAAHQMLVHFRDAQIGALNSFVHGGIHPLRRHVEGFPTQIAMRIIETSNGLVTMAGMTLALLTCDGKYITAMSRFPRDFADCLPALLQSNPA